MLGATLAGLAFSNSSVALVHGMSRPIGAHFHVPHGLSNAMLLPAITRYGLAHSEARYAEASRQIGFASGPHSQYVLRNVDRQPHRRRRFDCIPRKLGAWCHSQMPTRTIISQHRIGL